MGHEDSEPPRRQGIMPPRKDRIRGYPIADRYVTESICKPTANGCGDSRRVRICLECRDQRSEEGPPPVLKLASRIEGQRAFPSSGLCEVDSWQSAIRQGRQ